MAPEIVDTVTAYEGWTRLARVRVRLEDGTTIEREVEDHGRAVAMLPYDPVRRTALVIRLLRVPALLAAGLTELVEVPAGLAEGEYAADAARRELREETGLDAGVLEHVARVWTMPGISTEQMDLYLAPYSVQDRVGPGGGLESEHENITVVEMPLDALWAKTVRNEISDMKTLTLVLALHARKPHLFGTATAE
jgi:nudix-type nucleoside diphosphatase (YffH/AdpP family)